MFTYSQSFASIVKSLVIFMRKYEKRFASHSFESSKWNCYWTIFFKFTNKKILLFAFLRASVIFSEFRRFKQTYHCKFHVSDYNITICKEKRKPMLHIFSKEKSFKVRKLISLFCFLFDCFPDTIMRLCVHIADTIDMSTIGQWSYEQYRYRCHTRRWKCQ